MTQRQLPQVVTSADAAIYVACAADGLPIYLCQEGQVRIVAAWSLDDTASLDATTAGLGCDYAPRWIRWPLGAFERGRVTIYGEPPAGAVVLERPAANRRTRRGVR